VELYEPCLPPLRFTGIELQLMLTSSIIFY
jgi:hypothetical protein